MPTINSPGAQPIPGNGGGSVIGAIFGAVIRGGIVGDGDDCDPRGAPHRGGGRPIGGDIYGRNPMGGMIGGMGGMRGVGTRGRP